MCQFCKTQQMGVLHLKLSSSGAETFVWVCSGCGRLNPFNGPLFIAAEKVYAALTISQIQDLPVLFPPWVARCARCGDRYAELHHWAPQAKFQDADTWPTDYLCVKCHNLWHQVMTPNFQVKEATA